MKNLQRGFAIPILIAIVALLVVGGGAFVYTNNKVEAPASIPEIINNLPATTTSPIEPVFCTMDAKQCPDGSYVGRTGPKCEFACPVIIDITTGWKTYTDIQSGMTYKYPGSWRELGPGCAPTFGSPAGDYYISVCGPGYSNIGTSNLMISSYKAIRDDKINFDNYRGKEFVTEITIKDVKYSTIESYKTIDKTGDWTIYFTVKDGVDKDAAEKILSTILSTFKFVK